MPDYYDDDFATADGATNEAEDGGGAGGGVTVEAEFEVGEYEIVILSTDDATALESWLTTNEYTIPEGASDAFDPYVQGGSYFFVAKVKADEVTFRDGNAVLSPLRFYYDTPTFSLPIKLGLINAQGSQDLIVYTLGEEQRYEVANRPNVTIPTNIEVINEVRDDFGTFYRTLFAETVAQNPGAAVTEYSWASSSCDPCPGPTLDQNDIATLGGDVVGEGNDWSWRNWTLTRIHLRYDSSTLGDDLVFAEAEPIFGGREVYNEDRELETGSGPGWTNNFQGRYIIRHRWDGPVECGSPSMGDGEAQMGRISRVHRNLPPARIPRVQRAQIVVRRVEAIYPRTTLRTSFMTTSRSLMSLRAMTLQPALPLRVGVAVNQRTDLRSSY